MFRFAPSQEQLLSARFLSSLSSAAAMELALLKDDGWLTNKAVAELDCQPSNEQFVDLASEQRLLVVAEGLNLEKLQRLQQTLAKVLCFGKARFKYAVDGELGYAIEFEVKQKLSAGIAQHIESCAISLQLELVLLSGRPRLSEPGLLLMDMDSTVIEVECIDEMAKLAGMGKQVSEVTELAMQGALPFSESLINRVACLAGADEAIIAQVRDALPLMPGISRLVRVLKQHNWKVAIASGGFTYFAGYLQQRLGLDAAIANQLEIQDGKLTGRVKGDIVDASVKADSITRLAQQWGISAQQTVAMGDGANDLLMMENAALGVAFHAKPVVRQQADAAIRFTGLETLLWMLE